MLEDKLLIRQFKQGREDAFARIYDKYRDFLLTLAVGLLNDIGTAEDVVHSMFVSFAEGIGEFELVGSLKRYLAVCTVNRTRNVIKAKRNLTTAMQEGHQIACKSLGPKASLMLAEDMQRINEALAKIPYEQREVITLHLKADMKFREIAKLQNRPVNTIQSRYRYGLNRLRSLLDEDIAK